MRFIRSCSLIAQRHLTAKRFCSGPIKVKVTFPKCEAPVELCGDEGESLMDVIKTDDTIPLEACCGGMAKCSTCHVQLKEPFLSIAKDTSPPSDFELDVLDRCGNATDSSRLSCQIFITSEMNGMTVEIPDNVKDIRFSR